MKGVRVTIFADPSSLSLVQIWRLAKDPSPQWTQRLRRVLASDLCALSA